MDIVLFSIAGAVLIALLLLSIVAIRLLRRIEGVVEKANRVLEQSHDLIASLSGRLPAALENLEKLSDQAARTLDNADRKLTILGDALDQFRQISQRINYLEQRIQAKVEGPLMDAARVIASVSKAIKTFAETFNRR
ncbi:MAG: hypothetical protein RML15_01560 [Bacteroidota bacterium]|nr:hypothetical protein [Candidatus Kapabacteria bacterium]MDW8271087.1 hypothetical protein [Bacteroidota bacterium]